MRNLGILIKTYTQQGLGRFRNKSGRGAGITGLVMVLVFYVGLGALLWFLQSQTAQVLGSAESILAQGYLMGVFMALAFALQRISGGKRASDTEMLLALPLRRTEIVLGKMISRYLFNLAVLSVIIIPNLGVYFMYHPVTMGAVLANLLGLLLVPAATVGFGDVIDWLISTLFPNSRVGNVLKSCLTIGIILVIALCYATWELNAWQTEWLLTAVLGWRWYFWLPLIGISLVLFAAGMGCCVLTLQRDTSPVANQPTVVRNGRRMTLFGMLLKNETNRYLNSPTMMINTLISPLGTIALTIWLLVDQQNSLLQLLDGSATLVVLLMTMYGVLVMLTYPSAFSISMEGKYLWLLHSLPLHPNLVLGAKALFNLFLTLPIAGLMLLLLGTISSLGWWALAIFGLVACLCVIEACGGVLVNLCFPKLKWESEAAVIKHSVSSLVASFGGMLLVGALLGGAFGLLGIGWSIAAVLGLLGGLLGGLACLCVVLLFTWGPRRFRQL